MAERLTLARGGATDDVVVAGGASDAERLAAAELAAFLGANAAAGTFLVREGDLARYLRGYGAAVTPSS